MQYFFIYVVQLKKYGGMTSVFMSWLAYGIFLA